MTAAGCSPPMASLVTTRPASANIGGIARLAVLELDGPDDSGAIAHATILEELKTAGFYTLVDARELAQVAPAPLYFDDGLVNVPAAIEAGRRAGVDAILTGSLCYVEDDGSPFGSKKVRFGDPDVTAIVRYELIDVRSGELRDKFKGKSRYQGELTRDKTGPTSKQRVLDRLARECSADAVKKISPHRETVHVELAGAMFGQGAAEIREGNKRAAQGEWQQAIGRWQAALADNPDSEAALYNLGLAHEALQDFPQAEAMYAAAAGKSDKARYGEALDRVRRAHRDLEVVAAQQQRRAGQPTVPPQYANMPPTGYTPAPAHLSTAAAYSRQVLPGQMPAGPSPYAYIPATGYPPQSYGSGRPAHGGRNLGPAPPPYPATQPAWPAYGTYPAANPQAAGGWQQTPRYPVPQRQHPPSPWSYHSPPQDNFPPQRQPPPGDHAYPPPRQGYPPTQP